MMRAVFKPDLCLVSVNHFCADIGKSRVGRY